MNIKRLLLLITLLCLIPFNVYAYSNYVIPGGESIGIKINSKGVLVVGTYEINNKDITSKSGIKTGDFIIKSNNMYIKNTNDLIESIDGDSCNTANITYRRGNKLYNTKLSLMVDDGLCKTGLYVKDSITGIGTLTYIDPVTKIFGALGHEIIESSTNEILEIDGGTIFDSSIVNIKKSIRGEAGYKTAKYNVDTTYGEIKENTDKGIFGKYEYEIGDKPLYEVAKPSDIRKGKAYIRTVLEGSNVKEYAINILKIDNSSKTKNIIFEITDKELLSKTGGVVQGMSGSPIIQDNYIIGAVTHVFIEEPSKGYGIFIVNMLEEGEN